METSDLSFYMLIAIIAMAICMAITPVLIKFAPALGMLDSPSERKVHQEAIPRIGGVGIILGLIVSLFIWLPIDPFIGAFLFGCLVLLVFGAWDDAKELGPYVKFFGQFLAAISVVYIGDVYVYHFPFLGLYELPSYIGKPFTVLAIVGVINALNLSDGLDGLAGGEVLLSLAAVTYLSYQFNGDTSMIIAAAAIGGIFGFLRFNSHPARVFMGDSGSQTLGFVIGVLVVYLSQNVNPVLSPVIPLLLIGLPVVDSLVVFYLRVRRGDSLVVAAKDHLHHRLLKLGFYHYESVIIIYSMQILFVTIAVLLPYESDYLIMGIYLSLCLLVFSIVTILEKTNWRAHGAETGASVFFSSVLKKHEHLAVIPYRIIDAGLSLFIIAAAITSSKVPIDFGASSLALLIILLIIVATNWFGLYLYRLIMFVMIGFAVYLLSTYPPAWLLEEVSLAYIFFLTMAIASFVTARIANTDQFQITPLDYLVVIMAIIVSMAPGIEHGSSSLIWMVIQIIVLFYACELIIQNMKDQFNSFTSAAGIALALIAFRGIM